MKRVLVFGTFDKFHSGHIFFLNEAAKLGDKLSVSVARDKHVRSLKHKEPKRSEKERLETIKKLDLVDEAYLSDDLLGSFEIINKTKPDLIVLGFDQNALEDNLNNWMKQTKRDIPIKKINIEKMDIALAIAERDGKILLLQRKDKNPMWDKKWELPGGKIDKTEEPHQAVCRELKEETNLDTQKPTFLGNYDHDWYLPDNKIRRVFLHIFCCKVEPGEVICEIGKTYCAKWVDPFSALEYDLLEANQNILKRLYIKNQHGDAQNMG